jgi:ABC-2 type transport system ATP-binding protein
MKTPTSTLNHHSANHRGETARHAETRTSTSAAIRVRGLTKAFGRRLAVDNATFEVPRGAVAGFIGPNGAGKTTTMRMLLGLVRPSSGSAEVLGQPVDRPERYLRCVGALIEGPAFYGGLTGRANLRVLATLGGIDPRRIDAVLDTVGLSDRGDDPYRAYSLGMKQRLGIAGALLRDPDLLVLDEPTNGLDPSGIHEMRGLIRRIADSGPTVFLSSHLLGEIQSVCEYLVIVERGRLVYQGTTEELLRSAHEAILIAADPPGGLVRAAALARAAGYDAKVEGERLRISAPTSFGAELSRALINEGIALTEIVPVRSSLEDRFLQLTGEEQ